MRCCISPLWPTPAFARKIPTPPTAPMCSSRFGSHRPRVERGQSSLHSVPIRSMRAAAGTVLSRRCPALAFQRLRTPQARSGTEGSGCRARRRFTARDVDVRSARIPSAHAGRVSRAAVPCRFARRASHVFRQRLPRRDVCASGCEQSCSGSGASREAFTITEAKTIAAC